MPNGAVALKLVSPPEHPSKDTPAAGKPDKVEAMIGAAVAGVATLLCAAVQDHQHLDGLDPKIREAGGIRVAQLAEMWLAHDGSDHEFIDVARQQGRIVLQQYLPASFFRRYSTEQGGAALDYYVDVVFAITSRVVKDERAMRMAEAH
jgi:hypothetical protein